MFWYTEHMTTLPHYLTTLDYLPLKNIFFPAQMPSNKLMILLHGRGGAAQDFTWIPETFDFEDMHYLLLNAPDTYDDGYTWYGEAPHHLEGIERSSELLTQTFDMLFEKDFDARQSFLFGFSQGSLLTFEFGARYEKRLAGYIAVSGHINDPELLLQEMNPEVQNANWLCTHGTQDEALDFETAKRQIEHLQKGAFHITFQSYDKTHSIDKDEMQTIREWIKSNSP